MGAAISKMIAALMAAMSRTFGSKFGPWIAQALLFLGIEVSIMGATLLPFIDDARSAMGGIPYEFAQWGGVLNVDVYVSMILSAYAIQAGKDAGRMALLAAGRR